MTFESRLSFSANGSGVTLHTKYGGLSFNAEEFSYYQSLFKVADNNNLGKLLLGSTQLNMLLIRTGIVWGLIEKSIKIVTEKDEKDEQPGILNNQWLMLCKLIAFCQETKKNPSEKVFKQLHVKAIRVPLAEFHLAKATSTFLSGQFYQEYDVEVTGWQLYGEDYKSQHVKFKITTTLHLFNESEAHTDIVQEKVFVERRYSDFESFASILHRNYKGLVIPPLPLKNWSVFSASDTTHINQRKHEFQMFLQDLTTHPILKFCCELRAFLEASSPGYKAFVELYSHVVDNHVIYPPDGLVHSSGVSKYLSDGALAVSGATQAVAQTKAFGYISSLWGMVSKTVFSAPTAVHTETPEDATMFSRASKFLDAVAEVGVRVEHLVTLDVASSSELSKLSVYFKNLSDIEQLPDLARTYQIAHAGFGRLCRGQESALEEQFIFAQTPIVYLGRYQQSYQSSAEQRITALEALRITQRKEFECKKAVDMLTATSSVPPGQSQTSTSPSSTTYNEELLNAAKLDLAGAEDSSELAKEVEAEVTSRLRGEGRRLEAVEKAQLLNHLLTFAKLRASACEMNATNWQTFKEQLESGRAT